MENNARCPVTNCFAKWLISAILVFIILFAGGYLINHIWLMPIYENTASLWRPVEEMQNELPLLLLYYAALALVISALFCKIKKAKMAACAAEPTECKIGGKYCPIKFGICFGAIIGLLMGIQSAGSYIWLPIPGELAIKWFIGQTVQGLVIGLVLSLCCFRKVEPANNTKI